MPAATAWDMTGLLRNVVAISLLSAGQAIDLRKRNLPQGADRIGAGTMPIYLAVRAASAFVNEDRALDKDIREVCEWINGRQIRVLN